MEYNLVEVWLRKDPVRWIAGALAGLFAGVVMIGVAMAISSALGTELWFPVKLMGTILSGPRATEYANQQGIFSGLIIIEALCLFWGVVFAHFTGTNSVRALLAMGLVWAAFSWIFLWNLFLQSFKTIFAAQVPSGPVFPICLAYGLSLASVAFFDRLLRRK